MIILPTGEEGVMQPAVPKKPGQDLERHPIPMGVVMLGAMAVINTAATLLSLLAV